MTEPQMNTDKLTVIEMHLNVYRLNDYRQYVVRRKDMQHIFDNL